MNFFKSLSDIAEMAVAPVKKVAEEVCDLVDIETPEDRREREHEMHIEKRELELKIQLAKNKREAE